MVFKIQPHTNHGQFNPVSIVMPDMPISMAGVKTVLALRSRYGKPQKQLDDVEMPEDSTFNDAGSALE